MCSVYKSKISHYSPVLKMKEKREIPFPKMSEFKIVFPATFEDNTI